MSDQFPSAVPEIRVGDVARAAVYYEKCLGFHWDWGVEGLGKYPGEAAESSTRCRQSQIERPLSIPQRDR